MTPLSSREPSPTACSRIHLPAPTSLLGVFAGSPWAPTDPPAPGPQLQRWRAASGPGLTRVFITPFPFLQTKALGVAVSVADAKWPIFLPRSQHGTTPAVGRRHETAKLTSATAGSPAPGGRQRGRIGAEQRVTSSPTRSLQGETPLLWKLLKYWAIFYFTASSKKQPGRAGLGTRHRGRCRRLRKAERVLKGEGCDAKIRL